MAYDMRISDWISDVCSSDLGQHRYRVVVLPRLLQPERPEHREFLAAEPCRIDREPAGRQAVLEFATDRPEVAGAEEGGHVAVPVQAVVQAEPGIAERRLLVPGRTHVPIREPGREIGRASGRERGCQ